VLLRGRLLFCGCALTAAISQRPPFETSVMLSDQSAIDRHFLAATSSEWCGFARHCSAYQQKVRMMLVMILLQDVVQVIYLEEIIGCVVLFVGF
jgi:hypothetical protein